MLEAFDHLDNDQELTANQIILKNKLKSTLELMSTVSDKVIV
jgi:hypothetical protein